MFSIVDLGLQNLQAQKAKFEKKTRFVVHFLHVKVGELK